MISDRLEALLRPGEGATGQLFRYLVVGGAGYLLAVTAFAGLTALGVAPYSAVVTVFVLNGAFNFLLFRSWAFPTSNRAIASETRRFVVVALVALVVNYAIFALLYSVLGMPAVPAQALSIVGATPVSFAANRAWTFAADVRDEPEPLDMPR